MYQVADVLRELEALVAEKGEEYEASCIYVTKSPALGHKTVVCIAGRVLHKMGVTIPQLETIEGFTVGQMWGPPPPDADEEDKEAWASMDGQLDFNLPDLMTEDAMKVLNRAQEVQDERYEESQTIPRNWGTALEQAKILAEELNMGRFDNTPSGSL